MLTDKIQLLNFQEVCELGVKQPLLQIKLYKQSYFKTKINSKILLPIFTLHYTIICALGVIDDFVSVW